MWRLLYLRIYSFKNKAISKNNFNLPKGDFMKSLIITLISIMTLVITANAIVISDTTKTDTTIKDTVKKALPDFKNVDVVVETEWSDPEKTSNVDVYVHLKDEHPHIIMSPNNHKQCEIRIIKGITVKILNPKTGKLLKKYSVDSLNQ